LSFSSHDYAGHLWGQESWERLDLLLRLDDSLGEFLEFLDREVGAGHYAVVFTSDHGAIPRIEHSRAQHPEARRIKTSSIIDAATAAARRELGEGEWVAGLAANTL